MDNIDKLQPSESTELPTPGHYGESFWRRTTTPAVALTLLTSCVIAIDVRNPIEALGSMLFNVPLTFFFWWLICTFLLWLWQAIFGKRS